MADGILCKHCGWQESEHGFAHEYEGSNRRRSGYKRTLVSCRRFVGEEEPLDKLSENDLEAIEKQGDARAAWGQFQAHVRTNNALRTLEAMDKKIRDSHTTEQRDALKEKKKEFIEDIRTAHGLYVG